MNRTTPLDNDHQLMQAMSGLPCASNCKMQVNLDAQLVVDHALRYIGDSLLLQHICWGKQWCLALSHGWKTLLRLLCFTASDGDLTQAQMPLHCFCIQ